MRTVASRRVAPVHVLARRRPDEQVEERRPKRRTTDQPSPDELAGHATGRPISGARSEFHGQGVQNSGAVHIGGNLNIGVHSRSDQDSRFLADLRSTDPRNDKGRQLTYPHMDLVALPQVFSENIAIPPMRPRPRVFDSENCLLRAACVT